MKIIKENNPVYFSEERFEIPHLGLRGYRGVDYEVRWRKGKIPILIMAPHGGMIEPGTSQMADEIADIHFWFYSFEGIRTSKNYRFLHVPSILFNEPTWKSISKTVYTTITIHGLKSEYNIIVGGKYIKGCHLLEKALLNHGFNVQNPINPRLSGVHQNNVANVNKLNMGVQLEVGQAIRTNKNEAHLFEKFVVAVKSSLKHLVKTWQKEGLHL